MKHWKSGFFFIDRRAIPDAMVWKHPDAAIDDPRPFAGSFNMDNVSRLSAHVIKLTDMPEGVLLLYGLSRVWKSRVCDSVLWGADGNVIGILDFLCLPEWTSAEDLVVGTPSSKIVAKAEASQKQKASIFGATSSHVSKRTRVGVLLLPLLKVLTHEILRAMALWMMMLLYHLLDALYRPTFGVLTKEVFKDPAVCKTIFDQFLTPREMVRVESLSDDQLAANMSVLHCMMMSHGGELLARYRRVNQSHHEYVLSTDSRLKGYNEKVASFSGLELQVSAMKKQVSGLNDKLSSSDASFIKSKATGKERKKNIKSLTKSVDNLHSEGLVQKFLAFDEFSRVQGELLSLAASAGFERGLSMQQTKDEFVVVLKKMANFMPGPHDRLAEASSLLVRPANIPTSREARASPPTKESTVIPASKSLELSANVGFTASAVAPEHNEEMGISIDFDDTIELVVVGSRRVSSGSNDVVVALSVGDKGGGLDPFSATGRACGMPENTCCSELEAN
nr:hypothetical protein [Tanacetum cinerariifolium]